MIRNPISQILLTALLGLGATSVAFAQGTPPPAAEQAAEQAESAQNSEKPASKISAAIKSQTLHAPEKLTVGQPLQLEIVVEHTPGTLVDIPHAFPNTRWDLLDSKQSENSTESATTTTISLNFAIFRPGQAHLPAFDIRILAPDGTQKILSTEKTAIFVRSAIDAAETPPFAPPRDPVAIWTSDYTLAWVGGFVLGGALLGALAVFAIRRRKTAEVTGPVRSAHEVALEKLRELEQGSLLDQGEVMIYYVRMSEAVREYLGRRFDFPGTELTTAEINAALASQQSRWPRGIALDDVKRWLEHCDFVKFSGAAPSKDAARKSLERAFGIVELTRRRTEIVIPPDDVSETQSPKVIQQAEQRTETVEEVAVEEVAGDKISDSPALLKTPEVPESIWQPPYPKESKEPKNPEALEDEP